MYASGARQEQGTEGSLTQSSQPTRPPLGGAEHQVEVVEKNTDTSWALFEGLQRQHEHGFEKTQAMELAPGVAAPAAAAPGRTSLDDVLVEARRNNRVCPLPAVWQKLYDFLPNKSAQLPGVPATRQEWGSVSSLQKRSRFREHIEWAASQGVLKQVHEALQRLPENRWFHMGE